MRLQRSSPRAGFTMLELMVVILVILLLAGLLMASLSKVMRYVDEVRTVSEIGALADAAEQFKLKYKLYPPGRIVLKEDGASSDAYSNQYLQRMFPGINLDQWSDTSNQFYHDWNGNGVRDTTEYMLEGPESLVLFVGGPPYGADGQMNGWHTDNTNPTRYTTGTRNGPFFEFNRARLEGRTVQGVDNWDATRHVWRGYMDPFRTPYAYFLARDTSMNNYPGYLTFNNSIPDSATLCGVRFMPYWMSCSPIPPAVPTNANPSPNQIKFHRHDKFQIVSAGRDHLFGQGGGYNQADPQVSYWNPVGQSSIAPDANGDRAQDDYDNITNFTQGRLVE